MNEHDIAEQAYKNGYEKGKQDAVKWIPVTERLPERECYECSIDVLFYAPEEYAQQIYRGYCCLDTKNWKCTDTRAMFDGGNVTHWMPLPELPKGSDEDGSVHIHD